MTERELEKLRKKYEQAKKDLELVSPELIQQAAINAQNAWNELKKAEKEFQNRKFMKKLGELYGI